MAIVYVAALGALLGWLVWNFVGEGGIRLTAYVLIGMAGALCGMLLLRYLGEPLGGTLGAVTLAPVCAFVLVSLVAFLDRRSVG